MMRQNIAIIITVVTVFTGACTGQVASEQSVASLPTLAVLPSITPSDAPSATPELSPVPTNTPSETPMPPTNTPEPTATLDPTATNTATPIPSATPIPTFTPQPDRGLWILETSVNPMDDTTSYIIGLEADQPVQGWLSTTTPLIVLSCDDRQGLTLGISAGTTSFETGLDYETAFVRLRFDREEPTTRSLPLADSRELVFFVDADRTIRQFLTHETFLFEFTPFSASSVVARFDLRGLGEAMRQSNVSCFMRFFPDLLQGNE